MAALELGLRPSFFGAIFLDAPSPRRKVSKVEEKKSKGEQKVVMGRCMIVLFKCQDVPPHPTSMLAGQRAVDGQGPSRVKMYKVLL